ncbi:MAG: glycosyltransferase family 4 protein [Sphingopyxis sp.]|uniref:glycosyltransferase family 4 protein n=1 Tax=Sphingopyxis sp. TaxID=1908224 RepID=UPI002ABB6C15|nr:glycosyltransferase family 4 protein [Sphingopyxis sp.]MDZ3830812.1 glycosyltransferase family 4 protein [Sphingopyxis sp.]
MTRPRLVNLLDDFALGGVSRGLGIFDSAAVRAVVHPSVVAIRPDAIVAPRLDADIIVTHFPPSWRRLAFLVSLGLRNPQARIIHVEHSYTRAWEAAKVPARRRFRLMLGLSCRMVDQIVCVSQAQARWLEQAARLDPRRIEVIYPFAENRGIDDLALPDFQRAAPLRVGAYGRFHEAKGFDRLIRAWRDGAMPGTELLIGGFGPQESELRALAASVPGIRFVGRIDDVPAFLAQCDIVAVPSRWEAFGQVATEARQAGRPILVAPVDGLPEQVGSAGMVVDFASLGAVERAFASLDPLRLAVMAREARRATAVAGPIRQREWARLLSRLTAPCRRAAARAVAATPQLTHR